ncbi:putative MFS-type transporter YdeG [Pseudonocardia sulfidoxydans NBRC 16205]|uniref:Putative MFS-type transporter YdeG n=1 Tax=Pseudonocardia sulfidoxydans NBRC 16205 TaxID=1223511 RepID=A0A511DE47_9PSEU|nr:MFS transporter [Pseudonocardia sulfidoxydans]GEL23080.1 putative MFS-type transporter YdeG [Pseudonocardia sulfidoxydans NBRC 16205]
MEQIVTEPPAQRRILRVLIAAQVLSGAGLAAGITVGALLAQDMLDTTGLAGLPAALFTVGSAAAAAGVGRLSDRAGRRAGLTWGYALGALGCAGVVIAAVIGNVPLLFTSFFVYGAGTATNLQARYAGADLADPARRGRAVSAVLVATTLGGVLGPNLVAPMGAVATAWGIPPLAGPFLLAGAAYAVAALVLGVLLRPDPLLLARELAVPAGPAASGAGAPEVSTSGVVLGASIMILTQLVMVAIMTMTPIHMAAHGHGLGAAGLVIAIHVAAMFLPSPITGRLVDRAGAVPVAVASGATLLVAGVLAAVAPGESLVVLTVALALLGLGWNLGLVSGTAIITDAVPLERRATTQGTVDVGIAISGTGAGLASGLVVAAAGFPALSLAGAAFALAIVPIVALTTRGRRPAQVPDGS